MAAVTTCMSMVDDDVAERPADGIVEVAAIFDTEVFGERDLDAFDESCEFQIGSSIVFANRREEDFFETHFPR